MPDLRISAGRLAFPTVQTSKSLADADFGYVGWKPGKVNLYVGKECVVRDVPEDEAPDRLVELIKEHGSWTEPALLPS